MQVNPINENGTTFNGAYKLTYTEEGAKKLKQCLNKRYNDAWNEIERRVNNKKELEFLGIRTGLKLADPKPFGTDLLAITIEEPRLIEGGHCKNPIKVIEGHHPDTNHVIQIAGSLLYCYVTKGEAEWLGLKREKDYTWEQVNKLSENRQERLKYKGVDLSEIFRKDLYVFSGQDCFDYIKYHTQEFINRICDEVKDEHDAGLRASVIKKIKEGSKKLSNFVTNKIVGRKFEEDSPEPTWEKRLKEVIEEDKIETEKFNKFLAERDVKDVGTAEELIEILKAEKGVY